MPIDINSAETEAWHAWARWRKAWAGGPSGGLAHDVSRSRLTTWPPVASSDIFAALTGWAKATGRWLDDGEQKTFPRFGDFFVGPGDPGFEIRFGTDFGVPNPHTHDVTAVMVFAQMSVRECEFAVAALLANGSPLARDALSVYADQLEDEGDPLGLVISLWLRFLEDDFSTMVEMRARLLALRWS